MELAVRRLRHDPCGEVHRVAHDRVGAPVARPDLAGEHVPAVDADAHREPPAAIDHASQGEQHALLVVTDDPRRARGQQQLAAAVVDVGGQEADLVVIDRALHVGDELVQRVGRGLQPSRSISSSVPEKRRNATVTLRCSDGWPPAKRCARTIVGRHAGDRLERRALVVGFDVRAGVLGCARQQQPGPSRAPAQRLGSSAAVCGLITTSPASAAFSMRTTVDAAGPDEQLLAVGVADEEEVKRPAVHALRDPQRDLAGAGRQASDLPQRRAHAGGGVAGALGVPFVLEQQQQRVAAELQEAAAVRVGDG